MDISIRHPNCAHSFKFHYIHLPLFQIPSLLQKNKTKQNKTNKTNKKQQQQQQQTHTLNAGTSVLISKKNCLKFLTLHSPFCLFLMKML